MIVEEYNNIDELLEKYASHIDQKTLSLFQKPDWFKLLANHIIPESSEPLFFCITDMAKNLVAIIPTIVHPNQQYKVRRITSLSNFYSLDFAPIFTKKTASHSKVYQSFIKHLVQKNIAWDILEFSPTDPTYLPMIDFIESCENAGLKTQQSHCHYNWVYHNVDDTYEEYIKNRPKKIRDIPRLERKLQKKHQIEIKLTTSHEDDVKQAIADYEIIYEKSWKDKENYPAFIPEFISQCAEMGILRLGILYLDQIPVASQFNIHDQGTSLIYKLSYDEKYKNQSVGSILSYYMMAHAFEKDQAQIIDYGCGNDGYKKDWMSHRLERQTFRLYNKTPLGKIYFLKDRFTG